MLDFCACSLVACASHIEMRRRFKDDRASSSSTFREIPNACAFVTRRAALFFRGRRVACGRWCGTCLHCLPPLCAAVVHCVGGVQRCSLLVACLCSLCTGLCSMGTPTIDASRVSNECSRQLIWCATPALRFPLNGVREAALASGLVRH